MNDLVAFLQAKRIQKATLSTDACLDKMTNLAMEHVHVRETRGPATTAFEQARDRASESMLTMFAATYAAPPPFADELDSAREAFRQAFDAALNCAEKPNIAQAQSFATVADSRRQAAMMRMGVTLDHWAQQVWSTEGALFRSMGQAQDKATMAIAPEPKALPATASGNA